MNRVVRLAITERVRMITRRSASGESRLRSLTPPSWRPLTEDPKEAWTFGLPPLNVQGPSRRQVNTLKMIFRLSIFRFRHVRK